MSTFEDYTKKFVRLIQGRHSKGGLIPNTRLNDSGKLLDSTRLVIKTKRTFPLFQKPYYRVSDYKLEDLLDVQSSRPEWFQTTLFMEDYNNSHEKNVEGKLGGDVMDAGGNMTARVSSKVKTKFGKLNKHEVDIVKVKRSIKSEHLLENPELNKGESLVLVKERIFTTTTCELGGSDTLDAGCDGKGKVQLAELFAGGAYSRHTECLAEIPPNVVIAFSVQELKQLKVPDDMEGFESDGLSEDIEFLEGCKSQDEILSRVWTALWEYEEDLQSLADLPQEIKSSLFLRLREVLKDRTDLQKLLENTDGTTHESGIQLLVGTLEELPDVALDMLTRCSPECLQELSTLVTRRKTKKPVSLESLPGPLQDGGEFNWAVQFLCSFETLPDLETLWEETGIHPGVLLLVLSIAIQGFAAVGGCSV